MLRLKLKPLCRMLHLTHWWMIERQYRQLSVLWKLLGAATKITQEYKESNPEILWKDIIGMRNWLIHSYFDIDYEHIWNTVRKDLPVLIPQLQKLLKEFVK